MQLASSGWQRTGLELAAAYTPDAGPLVVASGDGDFSHLTRRHPGHVLMVSASPSRHRRNGATVLDPLHDGVDAVRDWLRASGDQSKEWP
jgi:hypothetical protein